MDIPIVHMGTFTLHFFSISFSGNNYSKSSFFVEKTGAILAMLKEPTPSRFGNYIFYCWKKQIEWFPFSSIRTLCSTRDLLPDSFIGRPVMYWRIGDAFIFKVLYFCMLLFQKVTWSVPESYLLWFVWNGGIRSLIVKLDYICFCQIVTVFFLYA